MALAGTELAEGHGADGGAVAVALASLGGAVHVWEGLEILSGVVALDHSRTLHFQDLQNGRGSIAIYNVTQWSYLIDRPTRHQTRSLEQFCSLRSCSSRCRPRHLQTPEKNWS